MYIISTFQYSSHLELAISGLEQRGIARGKILAVPLDKRVDKRKLFDTIRQSDGVSLFDLSVILGTIFMLFGVIYGFILEWGPIIWGLIGLIAGSVLGFIIDLFHTKNWIQRPKAGDKTAEVVIIVNCDRNQVEMAESILWNNMALGVGLLDRGEDK